ncbi:MAG: tetratricopeptide repeat-containing protein [Planctomycetota bacterium]|jgi:tetratricopeptide (TPR) repeat protein
MKTSAQIFLLTMLVLSCAAPQKSKTWKELYLESTALSGLGLYSEATKVAEEALTVAEKTFGPDHSNVTQSLNCLVLLYYFQGKYSEAEPLCKRALAINEKAFGKDHPRVATNLNNLAELYRLQSRYADAEPLHKRALKIREKALGPETIWRQFTKSRADMPRPNPFLNDHSK